MPHMYTYMSHYMPYAHVFVDGNSPFFHGEHAVENPFSVRLDKVHRLGGLVGVGRAWPRIEVGTKGQWKDPPFFIGK